MCLDALRARGHVVLSTSGRKERGDSRNPPRSGRKALSEGQMARLFGAVRRACAGRLKATPGRTSMAGPSSGGLETSAPSDPQSIFLQRQHAPKARACP